MNFIVYTFSVPGEELPFYVGKGLPDRPQRHFEADNLAKTTHFYNKLNSLLGRGIYPTIKVVASGLTEQQAFDFEISLIKVYGRRDLGTGCLCNHTDGGEGRSGQVTSYETIVKLSKPQTEKARANIKAAAQVRAVPVESFDLGTGKVVRRYKSQSAVKVDGYSRSGVTNVLRGTCSSHRGLGWRYS